MPYVAPYAPRERFVDQRANTIADLIMRGAQARAEAIQRSGEISGQMYANLGNIASGAFQAYAQERQQAPMRAQQTELQGLQVEKARDEAAQRKRAIEAQRVVDALPFYASGEGRQAILAALDGPARELAMKHYQEADEAAANLERIKAATAASNMTRERAQQELEQGSLDVFGALAAGVKAHDYDPSAFFGAVADAVHKGLLPLDQAGPMVARGIQQPEWIRSTVDELIARSPAQQALEQKRTAEERMLATAQATASDREADNARAQQQVTLQQQQAAEAARHNRAMEARPTGTSSLLIQTVDESGNPIQRIVPKIPGSEFAPPLTAQMRNQGQSYGKARPILTAISELSEKINTGKGALAKVTGTAAQVAAKANLDDDVAEYESMISGFTPLIARALGHTGVLTQQDVDSVKAMFPRPGDSKSLRDRKVARIDQLMGAIENAAGGSDASAQAQAPAGGGSFSVTAGGKTYTFPSKAQLDAFKKEAGLP